MASRRVAAPAIAGRATSKSLPIDIPDATLLYLGGPAQQCATEVLRCRKHQIGADNSSRRDQRAGGGAFQFQRSGGLIFRPRSTLRPFAGE